MRYQLKLLLDISQNLTYNRKLYLKKSVNYEPKIISVIISIPVRLWSRYYYLHFEDKKTETQRSEVICLRSYSHYEKLESEPRPSLTREKGKGGRIGKKYLIVTT